MRTPTAAELLQVWERGLAQPAVRRGLLLLGVAYDSADAERLSIGQRDARLLDLRERLFGSEMTGLAACPACAEKVELRFQASDIRAHETAEAPERVTFQVENFAGELRLPNSLDLERLDATADLATNRRCLLEACLLSARRDGRYVAAWDLPEDVVTVLAQQMAKADPQGEVRLDLCCPHCAHAWQVPLDIASFLWAELHAWALRVLREVHALATAYGWREADILALSPWRRRAYLDLLGA
jgi:hypothetical protein